MTGFTFIPLFGNLWLTIVMCVVVLGAFGIGCGLFVRHRLTSDATALDWVRRGLIAVLLCVAALGPSTVTATKTQAVNRTDVFFAFDVTGSMAVADAQYGSSARITRLEAAKKTVDDIMGLYKSASYAGVSFGTGASLDVPLTPDSRAISNWAHNLSVEPTAVSSGSSLDAPLDTLIRTMQQTRQDHPNDLIVLYYLSDGEQTSTTERRTFSSLRTFVEGGASIGLGSTAGGRVPLTEASTSSSNPAANTQQWVTDPSTKKPAISKMDVDNLKDIADEVSIDYLHPDATTTATKLTANVSHQYSMLATNKTHTHVSSFVWPVALALFGLICWEFATALSKQRRYL